MGAAGGSRRGPRVATGGREPTLVLLAGPLLGRRTPASDGGCSESLGLKEGERFDPTGRVKACPAGRGGTWRHQRSPQIRPRLALSPAMTGKSRGRCRLARCLYLPLVCEENPVILTL